MNSDEYVTASHDEFARHWSPARPGEDIDTEIDAGATEDQESGSPFADRRAETAVDGRHARGW